MLVALRLAHRLQIGVLLMWACCLAAAAATPWIAGGLPLRTAALCGEHSAAPPFGSPDSGPATPRAKTLECPMCLPLAAPQPADFAVAAREAAPEAPRVDAIGMAHNHERALRPPARAPPYPLHNHQVTS